MRQDIGRGKSGNKVGFPNPAAPQPGGSGEAAGTPPSIDAVQKTPRAEIANKIATHDEGTRREQVPARPDFDHALSIAVPLLLFAIVMFLVWFFSR